MNGKINIDGIVFGCSSVDVCFSNGGWDLKIIGEEMAVDRFGGELACPRILLYNINEKGRFDNECGLSVDVSWGDDSEFVDDSYITLFGEGFSILRGNLNIRRLSGDLHRVTFTGVSDLPFTQESRDIPFELEIDFEWVEN